MAKRIAVKTEYDFDDLKALLETLQKFGVTHFERGDIKIDMKLAPVMPTGPQKELKQTKTREQLDAELLYHSAG